MLAGRISLQIFGYFVAFCGPSAVSAARSLTFSLPGFGIAHNEHPPHVKVFNGNRVKDDSTFMVYYHDLSVAVVELGPKKLLLQCDIIEIYAPGDIDLAMGPLRDKTTPVPITFQEMVHLMDQCKQLDQTNHQDHQTTFRTGVHEEENKNFSTRIEEAKQSFTNNLVIFSGIIPGTKWCGTGDVAKDYHDLGEDISTDMCCRNHDLCPVKIRARSKKYNLDNDSIYTKSHCTCDDIFYNCMKKQMSRSSRILGHIYFNLVKVPCLQDGKEGLYFRSAKEF